MLKQLDCKQLKKLFYIDNTRAPFSISGASGNKVSAITDRKDESTELMQRQRVELKLRSANTQGIQTKAAGQMRYHLHKYLSRRKQLLW